MADPSHRADLEEGGRGTPPRRWQPSSSTPSPRASAGEATTALSMAPLLDQTSTDAPEFYPASVAAARGRGLSGAAQQAQGFPPRRGRGGAGGPPQSHVRRGAPASRGDVGQQDADIFGSARIRDDAKKKSLLLAAASRAAPETVGHYYCLNPLENPAAVATAPGAAVVYKAISSTDGEASALRRCTGYIQAPSDHIVRSVDIWKRLRSPSIVRLKEALTTREFTRDSTNELVFAYEYYPGADTLKSVFLPDNSQDGGLSHIPEDVLWAFAAQLLGAIQLTHSRGLALRDSLSPSGILLTGRNRVRVNKLGIADAYDVEGARLALEGDTNGLRQRLQIHQKEDLANLGKLLLMLAGRSQGALVRGGDFPSGVSQLVTYLQRSGRYSTEVLQFCGYLLGATAPGSRATVKDMLAIVAPRLAMEYSSVWAHADSVEHQLMEEMDASRLLRLTALLGFVNEREGGVLEPQWSETGDNYLLKLFRDFVFHQTDEEGRPMLDYAHVVENLSRLDAGTEDRVLLTSRDGGSLLIASFSDMKRCLYNAVEDLRRRSAV